MAASFSSELQTNLDAPVPRIDIFSDELLMEIFSHIPPTDKGTFCSLSLTSKRISAISLPFLYHTYHCSSRVNNPARSFILGLANRPHLGSHVKSIVLGNWREQKYSVGGCKDLSDPQSLLPATERFRFPTQDTDQWKKALKDDLDDAKIALLLLLTPNLRDLRLFLPYPNPERGLWILRLLDLASNLGGVPQVHDFAALRSLEISHASPFGGFSLCPFMPFFRLPSLRIFSASNCLETGSMHEWSALQNTSYVESITFTQSQLSVTAIGRVLGACKAVKSFHFEGIYLDLAAAGGNPLLNYWMLDEALQRHMQSLESLKIGFADPEIERMRAPAIGTNIYLHSLGKFPKLKVIDVVSNALPRFGITSVQTSLQGGEPPIRDILPCSLQKLVLNHWGRRPLPNSPQNFEPFSLLISECPESFPELRWVEVHAYHERDLGWDDLINQFQSRGVDLLVYPLVVDYVYSFET